MNWQSGALGTRGCGMQSALGVTGTASAWATSTVTGVLTSSRPNQVHQSGILDYRQCLFDHLVLLQFCNRFHEPVGVTKPLQNIPENISLQSITCVVS